VPAVVSLAIRRGKFIGGYLLQLPRCCRIRAYATRFY